MAKNQRKPKQVEFTQVLAALLDDSTIFPPGYLHQFSDLDGIDLASLKTIWLQINPTRRAALLEDLEDLAESDTLVLFDNVAELALIDPDPRTRATAVRLLWENTNKRLMPKLINLLLNDPNLNVRVAAATSLGMYVYEGELEELDPEVLREVEDNLIRVTNGEDDIEVRRHALKSLGFSSRPEVPDLITKAYESGDRQWLISALFAMGRSAVSEWEPDVLAMINHPIVDVQREAIRAAGELGLASARLPLLEMLEDEDLDDDISTQTIWALSQIGGEDVRETIEALLEETEDEDEVEFLEGALDNLSFTEDMGLFDMLEIEGEAGEPEDSENIFDELLEDDEGEDEDEQK